MKSRFTTIALFAAMAGMSLSMPAQASTARVSFGSGDTASPAPTIEVLSWSWGVSNAGSGKRDMATGMASGKRMHKPLWINGPLDGEGTVTIVSPRDSASGQASGKSACSVGKHFASVVLDSPTEKVSMSDLTVMKCTADGMILSYASAENLNQPQLQRGGATKSSSNIQNN